VSETVAGELAVAERVVPTEGWGVLHLFFRLRGPRDEPVELADARALLDAYTAEEPYQALLAATLGQRADLSLMLLGPDLRRLQRFHADLMGTRLGERLEEVPELSFVSLTELSEYTPTEGQHAKAMMEARLHPRLPQRKLICFYPMAKKREGEDNWYLLPYEQRRDLMFAHGKLGRSFAGRVLQLITGAFGLSDWEWGVTLLADDPKAIKDVVHDMRFDEASARYALFGPFTVGLLGELEDAVELAGLRRA
jgi:hydrogen peroxide-dependent heme synthase